MVTALRDGSCRILPGSNVWFLVYQVRSDDPQLLWLGGYKFKRGGKGVGEDIPNGVVGLLVAFRTIDTSILLNRRRLSPSNIYMCNRASSLF
jgi:hypothetical protein